MGDPGVPVMLALLAVPVCVLLFVVVLALMGGRWTVPAPLPDPDLDLDRDLDLDLYREPVEELAPFGRGYAPRPVEHARPALPAGPAAPERALPAARPRAALPPARPQYGAYSRDPYERPEEDDASSRQAFPSGPYRHQ